MYDGMDFDLNDFDPFHPIVTQAIGYWGDIEIEFDSEPMDDYNWEEWLDNGE